MIILLSKLITIQIQLIMIHPFRVNLSKNNSELYHKHLYQQPSNPRIESTPWSDNTTASAAAIVATIRDSISMSCLPVPQPIIFKGELIEYSDWKFSFYALVDRKCISASDKMYYLRGYIEGPAEEAICGLFLHSSEEGYVEDTRWKIQPLFRYN